VDLTKESFDGVEDVQTFTLQPSQLAVVIASYDKTIGMTLYIMLLVLKPSENSRAGELLHVSNEQLYNASARDFDVKTVAFLHLSHVQLNIASARDYDVNVC